jgi:H+/Cl- antiporter ClcA
MEFWSLKDISMVHTPWDKLKELVMTCLVGVFFIVFSFFYVKLGRDQWETELEDGLYHC